MRCPPVPTLDASPVRAVQRRAQHAGLVGLLAVLLLAAGCRKLDRPKPLVAPRPATTDSSTMFRPTDIGAAIDDHPWIAHVVTVDLDRDGRDDVLACEARENKILWLRQAAPGQFEERVIATNISGPVHAEQVDFDGDGDRDVLVSVMGVVFPNNDKIGSIVLLENDGRQNFTPHTLIEGVARVTDVRAADLNGDGKLDLAVGQFGYDQGEVRWMERTGPYEFRSHIILDLSGAINVCVADFTGDGRPDIVALISQQWEEIFLFVNEGGGRFTAQKIFGSTNEDYGSSGMSIADLNGDGRMDVLYTNGDGFGPAAVPGPRPWHGLQWLENRGGGQFAYHRVADLPGAYSPIPVDLDGDGALDIVASSAYADWSKRENSIASLVWYRNDGRAKFSPRILARFPKDLISVTAGDFEGTGRPSLVTGGFYVYPPYENMGRITLWRRNPGQP